MSPSLSQGQSLFHAHPPLALLKLADSPDAGCPAGDTESDTGHGRGRQVLVCRACRTTITRPELGVEINGSHSHVFFNPHGLVFELGCFATAVNLRTAGPRTDEFTWFAGYHWQAVLCAGCSTLLGWRYSGWGGGFFGLIRTALDETDEQPL
jgi:hypothetical protein